MSTFLKDLASQSIAPQPWREIRVAVIVLAAVIAVSLWRIDSPALQVLVPAAVAAFYGVRIAISASRRPNHPGNPSGTAR